MKLHPGFHRVPEVDDRSANLDGHLFRASGSNSARVRQGANLTDFIPYKIKKVLAETTLSFVTLSLRIRLLRRALSLWLFVHTVMVLDYYGWSLRREPPVGKSTASFAGLARQDIIGAMDRANSVIVGFPALHADPYPRDPATGRPLSGPTNEPAGWGPTLRALADPCSDLFGRVSDWYCLCHPSVLARDVAKTGASVAHETKEALSRHVDVNVRPRFHVVEWQTERPPTDHADIFDRVCRELRTVRRAHPNAELVLVLSAGTQAMHAALLLAGSIGVVDGPVRLVQVERGEGARLRAHRPIVDVTLKIESVLQLARETRPAFPATDAAPSIDYDQARSDALRRTLELAKRAAEVPFPILLRGERGVGKSTLAALIRAWSPYRNPKRDREWPSLACGQFPDPETLRAELCGSVKGAFTGVEDRQGLLALADRDTLFLDEIHDLGEDNQRMLIRLIEEHRYYRVGERTPSTSRFRLISGTNQPDSSLRARLASDFLDRIRDIEITVPPLRECKEDLPWMWEAAWRRVASEAHIDPKTVDPHTDTICAAIACSALPGNWRDLRRLAVHLAVTCRAEAALRPATVKNALAVLEDGQQSINASIALNGKQRLYHSRLEHKLGPGLERFWQSCEKGDGPRHALETMLGTRHRASRAEAFIREVYPQRWDETVHGPRGRDAPQPRARRARKS